MHAFIALVRKDLLLYFSNRRALFISIAAPILIAAFFGTLFDSASSKRPLRIPVAVVDEDASEISRKIVAAIRSDASFDTQEVDQASALAMVRRGKVRAALILPQSFGAQAPRALLLAGSKPNVTVYFDPSQAMTLPIVRGLLAQHVMAVVSDAAFGGALLDDARASVNANPSMSDNDRHDLLSLFDSAQHLQRRAIGSSV